MEPSGKVDFMEEPPDLEGGDGESSTAFSGSVDGIFLEKRGEALIHARGALAKAGDSRAGW